MSEHERSCGTGRLLVGVAWVVLLLGLWQWGSVVTDVRQGISTPMTGDMAAAGRPPGPGLPSALPPLRQAVPLRVDIPGLGVQAPVVARGLDARGAVDPPPYDQPGVVGWYQTGVAPGAEGTALFVGHVDTETKPAVFYRLGELRRGAKVRVARDDGRIAEFTVEDVKMLSRDTFDARQEYGTREPGRAELRLITCGGTYDAGSKAYSANVVVSAYLTGSGS
ncbi:class F sortase [Streptomyces sp. NPDC047022]|uniref:class F sortase n=1 Tax=Streptomyces sp. NPDC047022 TaxID=3155737 RepID=UPI0033DDBBEB